MAARRHSTPIPTFPLEGGRSHAQRCRFFANAEHRLRAWDAQKKYHVRCAQGLPGQSLCSSSKALSLCVGVLLDQGCARCGFSGIGAR